MSDSVQTRAGREGKKSDLAVRLTGKEAGGIDLLVIYNSGRFRMGGRGSLSGMMPYGDANAIVMEMGREVIPVATKTPVLAGVCVTDPFRVMSLFIRYVDEAGL